MASKPIIVRIGLDDDKKPKILEPSMTSLEPVTPGPVTWEIYNSCTDPQLWIQFQGFLFTSEIGTPPVLGTTAIPLLFGSAMSFGAELNKAQLNQPIEPQTVTTAPTFPTAAKGSTWTYTILLLSKSGLEDQLDPIIVLSG